MGQLLEDGQDAQAEVDPKSEFRRAQFRAAKARAQGTSPAIAPADPAAAESASRARFVNRIREENKAAGTIYLDESQGPPSAWQSFKRAAFAQSPDDMTRMQPPETWPATAGEFGIAAVNAVPRAAKGVLETADVIAPYFGIQKAADAIPTIPDIPGHEIAQGLGTAIGDVGVLVGTGGAFGTTKAAILAGLETFGARYHALKADGASEDGAFLGALAGSGMDAFAIKAPLDRMLAHTEGGLGNVLTNGYVFGGISGAQQVLSDAITATATPKDMGSLLDWVARAGESATQGGLVGLFVGAVHSAFGSMKPKDQAKALESAEKSQKVAESVPEPSPLETGAPSPEPVAAASAKGTTEVVDTRGADGAPLRSEKVSPATLEEPVKPGSQGAEEGQVVQTPVSGEQPATGQASAEPPGGGLGVAEKPARGPEQDVGKAGATDVPAAMPKGKQIGTDLTGEPVFSKVERGDLARTPKAESRESQVGMFDEQGGLFEKQAEARDAGKKPEPKVETDPLMDPAVQEVLRGMAKDETGQAEVGGLIVEGENADGTKTRSRTKWVSNSEANAGSNWWNERPSKMTPDAARNLVEKAIAGKKLGPAQQAMLDHMLVEAQSRLVDVKPIDDGPTGIKVAALEADAAQQGHELPTRGEVISNEEANKRAGETLREDERAGDKLLREIKAKPRALDAEEGALALRELTHLRNERRAAQEDYFKAVKDGVGIDAAFDRVQRTQQDAFEARQAIRVSRTKGGQGLQFGQRLMDADFELTELENRIRVAKGGEKLSKKETAQVAELHEKIEATERKLAAFEEEAAKRQTELEAENALLRLKREVRARRQTPGKIEAFLAPKAEAALKRLSSTLTARSGPALTAQNLADAATVGAHLIVKGTAEAAAWTEAMVGFIGEHIRPHLPTVLEHAKALAQGAPLEARRLQASKAGLKRGIEQKRARIEAQDFAKREPRPIETDPEWIKLKTDSEEAKRAFERARLKFEHENRTRTKKIEDAVAEIFNLPKSFLSAYDFSAVFRQGGFFTLGHPVRSLRQMRQMFGAAFSTRRSREIDVAIRHRPGHEFAEASKLQLTALDDPLSPQEEAIRSRLSDRIPGIKASNRAYITYLNLQRAQMFDAMVRGIPGKPTIEQGRAIANAVNVGSGRGHMGRFDPGTGVLASVLWAPRLFVSRFQVALGQPLYRGDMKTRTIIAKEYARFLIGGAAVLTLGKLMGGTVEDDPRSSDFGKLRIGKSRIDPWAGVQQASVLLGRLGSGETKNAAGKVRPLQFDDMTRFLRYKLSPTVSIPINLRLGTNAVGEKVTPGNTLEDMFVPLTFHDIQKDIEAQGIPKTAALKILEAFGIGVQTYGSAR